VGEWGSGTPGEILPSTKWGESGVGVKLSGGDAVNSFTCGGYVVKLSGIRGVMLPSTKWGEWGSDARGGCSGYPWGDVAFHPWGMPWVSVGVGVPDNLRIIHRIRINAVPRSGGESLVLYRFMLS